MLAKKDAKVMKCSCKKIRADVKTSTRQTVQMDDCVCDDFKGLAGLEDRIESSRRKVGVVVLKGDK